MSDAYVIPLVVMICCCLGSIPLHAALYLLASFIARKTPNKVDDDLVLYLRWPTLFFFPLIAFVVTLPFQTYMDVDVLDSVRHTAIILLIATVTWVLINIVRVSALVARSAAAKKQDKDPVGYRRVKTQVVVICRVAYIILVLFAIAGILMTFPAAWSYGVSILASAGVAGLVITLAARPGLENIIASLTIALSQPIMIDDEVLVDTEYGFIEEITAQFVVMRTPDERRLIMPLTRFTSGSFQNWTRTSTGKVGSVSLTLEPIADLGPMRAYLARILPTCGDWDGRVGVLQVYQVTGTTMEVRIMASTGSGTAKLRLECDVREKMIPFLLGLKRGKLDEILDGDLPESGSSRSSDWPPEPVKAALILEMSQASGEAKSQ